MQDDRAYIILLQKHDGTRRLIEQIVKSQAPDPLNPVSYFARVNETLDAVRAGYGDLILSGDYFEKQGSFFRHGEKDGREIKGLVTDSSGLAWAANTIQPHTPVFRYSSSPKEKKENLAGLLDKDSGTASVDTIVQLATCQDLAQMLREKDFPRIQEAFPCLEFYDDFLARYR